MEVVSCFVGETSMMLFFFPDATADMNKLFEDLATTLRRDVSKAGNLPVAEMGFARWGTFQGRGIRLSTTRTRASVFVHDAGEDRFCVTENTTEADTHNDELMLSEVADSVAVRR